MEGLVTEEFVAEGACYRGGLSLRRLVAEEACQGGRLVAKGLVIEGCVAEWSCCRGGLSQKMGLSQRGLSRTTEKGLVMEEGLLWRGLSQRDLLQSGLLQCTMG